MKNECDGSGDHRLCATHVPHRHCECGEPVGKQVECCSWCDKERSGISIHASGGYIRETRDHTSDLAATRTDNIGYSPFKKSSEIFQFGNTDVISQKAIDMKSWEAKSRAKGQLSEPSLDLLE